MKGRWRPALSLFVWSTAACCTFPGCATGPWAGNPTPGGVRGESLLRSAETASAALPAVANQGLPAAIEATQTGADEPLAEDDVMVLERSLREELAAASDPADAALELAGLLCELERHDEALAALDTAAARSVDSRLRVARAGVLRDLGRRHLAVAELRAMVAGLGAGAIHPGLLFELAELEWMEGEASAAAATLAVLDAVHPTDAWCVANQASLKGLAAEIQNTSAPPRVRVRDLLGNLRGAPSAPVRIRVLEQLVAMSSRGEGISEDLATRAIAIACADESPAVRARAVQLADPTPGERETFYRTALADDAAIVRRLAAGRAATRMGEASIPLLIERLEREEDPDAFAAVHAALATCFEEAPPMPAAAAADPAERAAVVAAWRRRWRH